MKPQITRRTVLNGGLAAAAALARPAIALGASKVRYSLAWLPTGQYAYVYMARQMGFWKKRGIEVDIIAGRGSAGAIQGVAGGTFEFSGPAMGANILSAIKGLPLQVVATHGYDVSLGVVVPGKGTMKTAKDLEGKTIGVVAGGGDTPFLSAYFGLAGVDDSKVTRVSLDAQLLEQALMSGRVDSILAFGMSSIPNFVSADFPIRFMPFASAGLQFYWVTTLTRSDFAKKNPQLVTDFQAGLAEGAKFMLLNPEETIERHLKEHDEIALSKNGKLFTELGVGMVSVCMNALESREHGLGYSDLGKVAAQANLVKQYTAAPTDLDPPPVANYVTNAFLTPVTLTAEEWQGVAAKSHKYAALLGKA